MWAGGAAGLTADGVVDGRPVGTVRSEEHEGQLRQLALQQPERVDQTGQVLARLLGAERQHVGAAVEAGQVHRARPVGSEVGEPSGTTATRSAPSSSRTWSAVCWEGTWTVAPRATARCRTAPKCRTAPVTSAGRCRNQQSCTDTMVGSALGGTM